MPQWRITHILDEATTEIAFLFQNDEVKREIKRVLQILTEQDDPRSPADESGLIVDELEYDAPGWFRVKIPRYGIRIVFRLIIVLSAEPIELGQLDSVPDEVTEKYLDITQAGYRKDVYGEELRRRYRKNRDNP